MGHLITKIWMAPENKELRPFARQRHELSQSNAFWIRNAGATYQWAMHNIFDDILHKQVNAMFDDLVMKLKQKKEHRKNLCFVFDDFNSINSKWILTNAHFSLVLKSSCIFRITPWFWDRTLQYWCNSKNARPYESKITCEFCKAA